MSNKTAKEMFIKLGYEYSFGINIYGTNCNPESWKEWCMEDEEVYKQ